MLPFKILTPGYPENPLARYGRCALRRFVILESGAYRNLRLYRTCTLWTNLPLSPQLLHLPHKTHVLIPPPHRYSLFLLALFLLSLQIDELYHILPSNPNPTYHTNTHSHTWQHLETRTIGKHSDQVAKSPTSQIGTSHNQPYSVFL